MAMAILTHEPLNETELARIVHSPRYGGIVTFSGTVRDNARGLHVTALAYEAYEPLARKELARIAEEAEARWGGACAVAHRLGLVAIGDPSVIVVYAAPHRAEAFEACRWVIDTLKETVPIWKRETYESGDVWIEGPDALPAAPLATDSH
jgi:molybdopterin synthase catalytic subunit